MAWGSGGKCCHLHSARTRGSHSQTTNPSHQVRVTSNKEADLTPNAMDETFGVLDPRPLPLRCRCCHRPMDGNPPGKSGVSNPSRHLKLTLLARLTCALVNIVQLLQGSQYFPLKHNRHPRTLTVLREPGDALKTTKQVHKYRNPCTGTTQTFSLS